MLINFLTKVHLLFCSLFDPQSQPKSGKSIGKGAEMN